MNVTDLTSEKTSNLIEKGTAAGVGFVAFVNQATSKFTYTGTDANLLSKNKFEDALATIVGSGTVKAIDSSYDSNRWNGSLLTPLQIKPLSAFNKTTFTGAGVLIADWAIRAVAPAKYYKNLPVVPEVMKGAGIGLLVGGIIGGMFDPNPSGYTIISPSPVTGQIETGGIATGNVPYARAGSSRMVYSGSILA